MHPLGKLISLDEALELIASHVQPIDRTETVDVAHAVGRVLAETIRAKEDSPATDRSRMDGYAVASSELADLQEGQTKVLKLVGRVSAGSAVPPELKEGTCLEIATGASLPARADAVVPVELARPLEGGESVEFSRPVARGTSVSLRGSDYRAGEELVRAGDRFTPARVAAAASANVFQVNVRARPKVLVVPTGDEVVPLGAPLSEGQVRDSNSHGLTAFVTARGALPDRHPLVRDSVEDVLKAVEFSVNYDAAVFSGGTSAGVKDFLATTLAQAGQVLFHGVRLRPGKPVIFGKA